MSGLFILNMWHDIPWYEGKYRINSDTNEVLSLNFARKWFSKVLSNWVGHLWHLYVWLWASGKKENWYLHQIVMLIKEWPCPEWLEVCHNDWNPLNNHPDNLRYDTRSENNKDRYRHGFRNHLQIDNFMKWRFWALHHNSKAIVQMDLEWNFIKDWWGIAEAWRELLIGSWNLSKCLSGKFKSMGGYTWKYK